MKKTRIRYKKLAFVLAALLLAAAAIIQLGRFLAAEGARLFAGGQGEDIRYCLFVGIRDSAAREADSLVLVSADPGKQTLYAVSIPGITEIAREGSRPLFLKDVYAEGGAEQTVSAVENLLHIRISRYTVFDAAAFSHLVEETGGVDFYVEQDMYHEDENHVPDIQLRQGVQTLGGKDAYGYMRFLDAGDGEIGRIQREERFMKAFLKQAAGTSRLYSWGRVRWGDLLPEGTLTPREAASLAYDVLGFPEENWRFIILPGEIRRENGRTVWQVNPVEIQKVVGLMMEEPGEEKEKSHDNTGKN